jgi:hypothetical protein
MKIHTKQFYIWLLVCFVVLLGASRGIAQKPQIAHAKIPFEFWIGDSQLPAGEYQIEHVVSPTLVLFRGNDGKTVGEASMLPMDQSPVKKGDFKLVFVVQDQRHYLYEVWGAYGKRQMTSAYGLKEPTGENRVEVPIVYR